MQHNRIYIYVAAALCVILSVGIYFLSSGKKKSSVISYDSGTSYFGDDTTAADAVNDYTEDNELSVIEETDKICVFVCGAVVNPGVYYVSQGARIYEAVELAGGLLPDADADYVNQAGIVSDCDRIYIPYEGDNLPVSAGDNTDNDSGLVNINTAGSKQLQTLPGIGEARAESIIAYREEHGNFASCEDIMNVSGIKQAAYSRIKDKICVN